MKKDKVDVILAACVFVAVIMCAVCFFNMIGG
jgi:hypothetical protein